jgi:hypothetical protein
MAKTNRRQKGEGSLYERPGRDGRTAQWVAVAHLGWKDGRRERREFTGATPEAARARREDFLAKRRDGFTLPKDRPPTIAEWAHHWLYDIARTRVQDTTWPTYRSKTELHIIPWFEHVPLTNDAITEELILGWHAHLKRLRPPVSDTSIMHTHRLPDAQPRRAPPPPDVQPGQGRAPAAAQHPGDHAAR